MDASVSAAELGSSSSESDSSPPAVGAAAICVSLATWVSPDRVRPKIASGAMIINATTAIAMRAPLEPVDCVPVGLAMSGSL